MLELNLDYEIHSIDDILSDPDLDIMLKGINKCQSGTQQFDY